MSWTNLRLGGNWERHEWPDSVEVTHEGEAHGRRYVPERVCRNLSDRDWEFRCSECGVSYDETTAKFRCCPGCGARVVRDG